MELVCITVCTVKMQGFAAEVCTAHINETVLAFKTDCKNAQSHLFNFFGIFNIASFPDYSQEPTF